MSEPLIDRAASFDVADDLEAINRLYRERRWSDGLPIVPPTAARVERMLTHSRRGRHELVARVAPGFGAATVERIAINAVMAGCDPEYLPVLIAATEAVSDPEFNLQGIQATTNPVAVWLVLNGPVAQQLQVNASFNCIGQGHWANATVTVVGAEGTMNLNTHAKGAVELARVIAETMIHPTSNEYVHGGEPWFILGSEHAEIFRREGWDKAAVKRELWERSKMAVKHLSAKEIDRARASRTPELGELRDDTLLPISPRPEDIHLIVAGGPGTHSVYIPCFGNSRAVMRRIDL